MRFTKFFFLYFLVTIAAWAEASAEAEAKTLSGGPRNSDLIFHFKRICVPQGLSGTRFALSQDPTIKIGAFRAEYDLDRRTSDQNLQPVRGFRNVEFIKHAEKVNKKNYGSKEYIFEDFSIKVPMEDLESAMALVSTPRASNIIDFYIDAKKQKPRDRFVRMAGFYVEIENTRSFVAFDGTKSHISTNLKAKERDDFFIYERLWPRFATMLGTTRTVRSGPGVQLSHLESPPDCTISTNFEFSVEILERPKQPARTVAPANRRQGVR